MPNALLAAAQAWDLRKLQELRTFRGHTKDVLCAAWHPVHEELFASGGHDGGLLYWLASRPRPQACPQTDKVSCAAQTQHLTARMPECQVLPPVADDVTVHSRSGRHSRCATAWQATALCI